MDDRQTELCSLRGSLGLFLSSRAVLLAALGMPSGALLPGLGAVQPVLGDGAGVARLHQVHSLGAQVDSVVLVWGKGTRLSGLSPALGSCQPSLPAPSHCVPELGGIAERSPPRAPQPWSRIVPGSCQAKLTSYKEVDALEHLTRGARQPIAFNAC